MEASVLKSFVKLLKDKEVLQQCEAFSKFIKSEICDTYDDMENSCTRTSTTGYLPEVCTCRQNVREVIEGALLFIENITKLYLCGQREVTIKHALQNNDYGPLNRFALEVGKLFNSVVVSHEKLSEDCRVASTYVTTVKSACDKYQRSQYTKVAMVSGAVALATSVFTFGAGAPIAPVIGGLAGLATGVVGAINNISQSELDKFQKLFVKVSKKIRELKRFFVPLFKKVDQHHHDIEFSLHNNKAITDSLTSEDRAQIFIVLDSIYNACDMQNQQIKKCKSIISEVRSFIINSH